MPKSRGEPVATCPLKPLWAQTTRTLVRITLFEECGTDFVVQEPAVDLADVVEAGGTHGVDLPADRPDACLDLGHLADLTVDAGMDDRVVEQSALGAESFEQQAGRRHFLVEQHALVGQARGRTQHGHGRLALGEYAPKVLGEVQQLALAESAPPIRAVQRVHLPDQPPTALACLAFGDVVSLDVDDEFVAAQGVVGPRVIERGLLRDLEEFLVVRLVDGQQSCRDAPARFGVGRGADVQALGGEFARLGGDASRSPLDVIQRRRNELVVGASGEEPGQRDYGRRSLASQGADARSAVERFGQRAAVEGWLAVA